MDWRKKHPEKARKSNRKYYQKNKKRLLLENKKRYEKNKDRYLARCREYRGKHKEEKAKRDREWQKNNPEKRAIINKRYNSKPRSRMITQKRQNERYRTNPAAKLHNSISCGIRNGIKNKSGRKAFDLLPFTIDQLKKHLERQFTEGMTWDNYGEWHIDHEIPVSAFNFTKAEHDDFKRCWALKNLRPMWALDNCKKGASLEKHFQPRLRLPL